MLRQSRNYKVGKSNKTYWASCRAWRRTQGAVSSICGEQGNRETKMISVHHSRLASGVWAGISACLIAIAIGLFLSEPHGAMAQSIYANLSGTVTDTSGAVVAGAKVTVEDSATKVIRQFVTNGSGYFSATQLPTGTYNVSAEAKGFQKWQGTGIVLQSSDDKALSIPLKIGAETETVTVSAGSDEVAISDSGA